MSERGTAKRRSKRHKGWGAMTISRFLPRAAATVAGGVCLLLIGTLQQPVEAAAQDFTAPTVQKTTPLKVRPVPSKVLASAIKPADRPTRIPSVRWPATGTASVAPTVGRWQVAGGLPIAVRAGSAKASVATLRVRVTEADVAKRLGIKGIVVQFDRPAVSAKSDTATAPIDVAFDTKAFAAAYGGGWGDRLHLVRLPACSMTTPEIAACRTGQDVAGSQVGADQVARGKLAVSSSSTVMALAAAASGSAGSYAATPLSQSSSWDIGQQSGSFSWSYPLRVPPGSNGPTPQLGISYDSGSVDGRTAATNNQPSWVGEGFDLGAGYVERRYVSCRDDMTGTNVNKTKTGDLCWRSDNAVLSLGGHSGELVKDSSSGKWKLLNDDGSRIEKLTGATGSPAKDGEYWKLTTSDGTQYFFGKTKRYAADPVDSASVWTVPVAGNQTGEPCNGATFKASFCTQAWRWNVDYVVDVFGNTMSYSYIRESNRYQREAAISADADSVAYSAGGYLSRIDYGTRAGKEVATVPARVNFSVAERCLPVANVFDCDPAKLTSANATRWPDVPFDQICTSTSSCGTNASPSFFTRKRLTSIATQVQAAAGSYNTVDQWDLAQDFYSPADSSPGGLKLNGITHTGKVGSAVAMPAITFGYEMFRNRVTGLIDGPTMYKPRLTLINNESGGQISPHYDTTSADLCTSSSLPASAARNTTRCFPSYWSPEGATDPVLTYFYKYVIDQVAEKDAVGGAVDTVTSVKYLGGAAWKYDDNELTPAKLRTWGDWRGYGTVEERRGDGSTPQTLTRTIFLRGMDGNRAADGSSVSVKVADSKGGETDDLERLNGTPLDTTVWDGDTLVSTTISKPSVSAATATSGTKKSTILGPGTSTTYTAVSGAAERVTRTTTKTDPTYAVATEVDDEGDLSTTADDSCTRYTYATRNATAWIVDAVSQEQVNSARCATAASAANAISDTRTLYDKGLFGAMPTKGLATETQALKTAGGTDYLTRSKAAFDDWGRPTSSTDAMGNTTTTAYTQLAITGVTYPGGVVTVSTTDPKSFKASTSVDPAWGSPVTETDINSRVTSLAYDGLGRLTGVWLPTRAKSAGTATTASMRFAYSLTKDKPSVVTTQELLTDVTEPPTYLTSYDILDGLLRPRQTQDPEAGAAGGRVITDNEYDSRGLVIRQNGPYYSTGGPSGTLVAVTDVQKQAWHQLTYDRTGRLTVDAFMSSGTEKFRTKTTYGGSFVTVDPPDGAPPTTTWTDASGRTEKLRRYHGDMPDAALGYDDTTYSYYPGDQLKQVTGPSGAKWDYTYDLRGRLTTSNDPDRGTTTMTYNDNDQVVTTKDARGKTIWTGYDVLGRQTETRLSSSTGALLTARTYDTVLNGKGKPATSTRYVGTAAYSTAITGYDAAYRPKGGTTTIPAVGSEAALAGTYHTDNLYAGNGALTITDLPKVPGLAAEEVTYRYDSQTGALKTMGSGTVGAIVGSVTRSPFGEALRYTAGVAGSPGIFLGQEFEDGTRRLKRQTVQRENQLGAVDVDLNYDYDKAGNVTSSKDVPTVSGLPGENQCFRYDYAAQLKDAWTPSSGDCSAPVLAGLAGPAPYWQSYSYDAAGNRKQEVTHASAGDTTRNYAYSAVSAAGKGQPDTLSSVVTTASGVSPTTTAYTYDETGNAKSATTSGATSSSQTMSWDDEGRLASATTAGAASSYVYDADGDRLIRREGTKTTLYLDDTEVQVDTATGAVSSTRYYAFDGKTVGMRQSTGGGLRVLMSDLDGNAVWSVDTATVTDARRRRFSPFGADRTGSLGTPWTGERGYVGGVKDQATGFTHLGAREYDPALGRFLSVDPVMSADDPGSLNPYAYSRNNPVTLTDPSGLCPIEINSCFDAPGGNERRKNYGHDQNETRRKQEKAGVGSGYTPPSQAERQAGAQLNAARANNYAIKQHLIEAAKMLGKIVMDELGITAGLDCFTKGDVGACAETAVTAVSSIVGGLAGKIITKYAWRWGKAARLAKSLYSLGKDLIAGVQGMIKTRREVKAAERRFKYLYRGVHFEHPAYEDAQKGIARPWGGHSDPARHNGGDNRSELTSWTTDEGLAHDVASDGPGPGIVLRIRNRDGKGYQRVASPDIYDESEVLVNGTVTGADVMPWRPTP